MLKRISRFSAVRAAREQLLSFWNSSHASRIRARAVDHSLPVFVVVTPAIVHLAAASVATLPTGVRPFLLLNGVDGDDELWLRNIHPGAHYIRLRTSLSGRSANLIPHGEIIDIIGRGCSGQFCLMDADNFILDETLIDDVALQSDKEFAAGPFLKGTDRFTKAIPETFMIVINGELFSKLRAELGMTAEVSKQPKGKVQGVLKSIGYEPGMFPETANDYWDTLQMYWCVAQHRGYHYRHIDGGEAKTVHIGGTSYLFDVGDNLDQWDYLPLSVHYLNLRLLELSGMARFSERFRSIREHYQMAEKLLDMHPAFADSKRYKDVERVVGVCMDCFSADTQRTDSL